MEEEIKEYLKDYNKKQWKWKVKENQEYIDYLNIKYPDVPLKYQCLALMDNISPYCIICGKVLEDIRKQTCSYTCSSILGSQTNRQKDRMIKQKNTLYERYGVDNIQEVPGAQDRRIETMIKKYGAKVSQKSLLNMKARASELNKKGRDTLYKKYGIINAGQLPNHAEKLLNAKIEKYGDINYKNTQLYINEMKERTLPTVLEKLEGLNVSIIGYKFIPENFNKISLKCDICNFTEYDILDCTLNMRLQNYNTPCKKCSGILSGSIMQQKLFDFIRELLPENIIILENVSIPNSKYQMDIYIPDYNLAIEFDGLYWHNDQRHDKTYHIMKTNLAEEAGIQMIHIFEDEWIYKENIVKSRLMNILGKNENKIFARKCLIKEVIAKDQRMFLNENHIQGYHNSSIAYGLYFNDELISLMSFSKPSKAKGQKNEEGTYELLRFCNKLNTTIIGAAGKLLKHFEKEIKPNKLLSFADRRWSQGKLYNTLGFEYVSNTAINYWYFKTSDMIRHHRYGLRKNKNDDQSLTEYQNRLNQRYLRIWDCGSMKFIKIY